MCKKKKKTTKSEYNELMKIKAAQRYEYSMKPPQKWKKNEAKTIKKKKMEGRETKLCIKYD